VQQRRDTGAGHSRSAGRFIGRPGRVVCGTRSLLGGPGRVVCGTGGLLGGTGGRAGDQDGDRW
jgi:hypothetical protein